MLLLVVVVRLFILSIYFHFFVFLCISLYLLVFVCLCLYLFVYVCISFLFLFYFFLLLRWHCITGNDPYLSNSVIGLTFTFEICWDKKDPTNCSLGRWNNGLTMQWSCFVLSEEQKRSNENTNSLRLYL